MKTLTFLITCILLSIRVFSQDTLYTTTGQVIAGKVTEVGNEDIKYKKATNLEGPTYVISKSDVVMIEYKNGSKDVFAKTNNTSSSTNSSQNYSSNSNPTSPTQVYVNPRPAVNVIVSPPSIYRHNPWGWGYRSNIYFGGGYGHGGYHGGGYGGGYGGHHGGGYGHHR